MPPQNRGAGYGFSVTASWEAAPLRRAESEPFIGSEQGGPQVRRGPHPEAAVGGGDSSSPSPLP